ncbi:hypothetical protein V6R21_20085 [Limibacter armeniacum]|uniref:hypothetical protein n=1 Tax=Limibacter armeniacum TaxID=466084 RepID=UPI002FE62FF2
MRYNPVQLFDINQEWTIEDYFQTKGSRAKFVCLDPNGTRFYYKESLVREGRDYSSEFWAEIIASKLGQILEFDILDYNIGLHKDHLGCISQEMNDSTIDESLIEGVNILATIDPKIVDDKKYVNSVYDFQFIKEGIEHIKEWDSFKDKLLNLIVFDAIISNSDRHSENWGMIQTRTELLLPFTSHETQQSWIKKLINKTSKEEERHIVKPKKYIIKNTFSPIYDSGCCFGRENDEDKINYFLSEEGIDKYEKYLKKGKSEIRWNKQKRTHFDLIKLINQEYTEEVTAILERVRNNYDKNLIIDIINSIDNIVPQSHYQFKLTSKRKEFIKRIIFDRMDKILNIR